MAGHFCVSKITEIEIAWALGMRTAVRVHVAAQTRLDRSSRLRCLTRYKYSDDCGDNTVSEAVRFFSLSWHQNQYGLFTLALSSSVAPDQSSSAEKRTSRFYETRNKNPASPVTPHRSLSPVVHLSSVVLAIYASLPSVLYGTSPSAMLFSAVAPRCCT